MNGVEWANAEQSRPNRDEVVETGWYTTEEVAVILKVDPSSLRRWRTARPPQGPPFVQISGRVIRYNGGDVIAYLKGKRIDPAVA
ncbi:helix-turn-helix domain-containing protein [Nocardia terpenica]|uniref:helix-turn-helix domain-containing protein n=1 Tax=Nocardia terpenica TaxID=455432 RepID=UPI00030C6C67|nr:helix-turn-helix domain-containing protein [Nocardia terpenica]NQE87563.1 helix-turn-helix domain-containing protein [Nocardia terpenica]